MNQTAEYVGEVIFQLWMGQIAYSAITEHIVLMHITIKRRNAVLGIIVMDLNRLTAKKGTINQIKVKKDVNWHLQATILQML